MIPERIEREILIEAPPDVVWAVVTQTEHVGRWLSDSAEIDLRRGGGMVLTWDEHGSLLARVERVEPPHSFSFRWTRGAGVEPREGHSTLVEFSLSAEGEHTRLRVVEIGFRELEWPEEERAVYAEENTTGWRVELDELREYVSTHVHESARR